MRKLSLIFSLFLCVQSFAGVKPIYLPAQSESVCKPENCTISVEGNQITLLSSKTDCSISFRGKWDLSEYRSIKFTIRNDCKDYPLWIFTLLADSKAENSNVVRVNVPHKTEGVTLVPAGQTKEVTVNFQPGTADRELIDDLYLRLGNITDITRRRNTPFCLAYNLYSFDADLSDVNLVKIAMVKGLTGAKFTISDIEIVPGKRVPGPEWAKKDKASFFPFVDKYGQFIYTSWPGKVKSDKDLENARTAEEKDLAKHPAPQEWNKYGGWANGPRQKATGQFRVEKIDGKWWMIDPEGCLFWSHGVVRVTPSSAVTPLDGRKEFFKVLPQDENDPLYKFYFTYDELLRPYYTARGIKETYDFSCANIYRKYGENYRKIWNELAHRRLRSWGLNTIANSSDQSICLMDKTVYNDRVDLGSPVEGYPEWPILEGSKGWWKFIDPYDELFETCVAAHLEQSKKKIDDPWCLGIFVDNEINWGNKETMGMLAIKAPASQASKRVFINALIAKYRTIDNLNSAWKTEFKDWNALYANRRNVPSAAYGDLADFSLKVIEKYFSTVRTVFKRIAPNKLYMGCRFSKHPDFVVRIASKYCDIISYNIYNYSQSDFSFPDGIDLPMMIGEFHVGSIDRGLFHSGQCYASNQKERGECYELYVVSCLRHPNIVGTNWHQFSDQPCTGRFDGENFQVGFTDICDTPYKETVEHLRYIGENMYKIRNQ